MSTHPTVAHPPLFRLAARSQSRLDLSSDTGAAASVVVLEDDVIRVRVLPNGAVKQPATWAIAPGAEDVPTAGRHRDSLDGFTCPAFHPHRTRRPPPHRDLPRRVDHPTPRAWSARGTFSSTTSGSRWLATAAPSPITSAGGDDKVYHYLTRDRQEMYFGLGERAGSTNRASGPLPHVQYRRHGLQREVI